MSPTFHFGKSVIKIVIITIKRRCSNYVEFGHMNFVASLIFFVYIITTFLRILATWMEKFALNSIPWLVLNMSKSSKMSIS